MNSLARFYQRVRHSAAAAVDRRAVRWEINSVGQLRTTDKGELVIVEASGGKSHPFKLAQIANIYFEPLLSEEGKADMFVWQRTNRPGKLEQVYAGTLKVGLIPKVEQLRRTLGIG